jgi:transcriptional regulator with XRE-family HTH domain
MRSSVPSLADLLNQLFERRRHPSGREYSVREVAAAAKGEVSRATIDAIRNGKNNNPTRNTLIALCNFFEVPSSYFFPELDTAEFSPLPSERE